MVLDYEIMLEILLFVKFLNAALFVGRPQGGRYTSVCLICFQQSHFYWE